MATESSVRTISRIHLRLATITLGLFFGMTALVVATATAADQKYTAYNIWYEHPNKVYSTGYQKGTMLPAGSEITNVKVKRKVVLFIDKHTQTKFKIIFMRKHHPGLGIKEFANRLITTKDFATMTKGFTKADVEAIKAGKIRPGMSKEAVLVSVGYPPEIRTPSTKLDTWVYWRDRFRNYPVTFTNEKVVRSGQ